MTEYENGYNQAIKDVLTTIKSIHMADSMFDDLDEVKFYRKIYGEILGLRGDTE